MSVQAEELGRQLLRIDRRDHVIRVAVDNDGRHAGVSGDIDSFVDQLTGSRRVPRRMTSIAIIPERASPKAGPECSATAANCSG